MKESFDSRYIRVRESFLKAHNLYERGNYYRTLKLQVIIIIGKEEFKEYKKIWSGEDSLIGVYKQVQFSKKKYCLKFKLV